MISAWSHPVTAELAGAVRRESSDSSSAHLPALWNKEQGDWMLACISAEAVDSLPHDDSLPYYAEWQFRRGIGEGAAADVESAVDGNRIKSRIRRDTIMDDGDALRLEARTNQIRLMLLFSDKSPDLVAPVAVEQATACEEEGES